MNRRNRFSNNKKAFGDVVSTLIMFIAVISVTVGLVVVFQNYVIDTQQSMDKKNKLTTNKLKTSISIINTYYNSSSNVSYYHVKNLGDTKLTTSLMSLFVDGLYQTNFTIVYPNNLSKPLNYLETQDVMVFVENKSLALGSHTVKVITQYSVGDEISFNI